MCPGSIISRGQVVLSKVIIYDTASAHQIRISPIAGKKKRKRQGKGKRKPKNEILRSQISRPGFQLAVNEASFTHQTNPLQRQHQHQHQPSCSLPTTHSQTFSSASHLPLLISSISPISPLPSYLPSRTSTSFSIHSRSPASFCMCTRSSTVLPVRQQASRLNRYFATQPNQVLCRACPTFKITANFNSSQLFPRRT